jgi:hypothetical protein
LLRERQPASKLVVEVYLLIQIDRNMQERARWCNLNTLVTKAVDRAPHNFQRVIEIGAPDPAAVYYAER